MVEPESSSLQVTAQVCSMLNDHPEVRSIQLNFGAQSWLGEGKELVKLVQQNGFRGWFSKHCLIVEVPQSRTMVRVDKRKALTIVTFPNVKDGGAQ